MRIKVVHKDGKTLVTNAETGEAIENVLRVEFTHDADDPDTPRLTIVTDHFELETESAWVRTTSGRGRRT